MEIGETLTVQQCTLYCMDEVHSVITLNLMHIINYHIVKLRNIYE